MLFCARIASFSYVRVSSNISVRPLSTSFWGHLEKAPLDGNHATAAAHDSDLFEGKVNLGRGVYKDDQGKNFVLPSVRMAEKVIFDSQPNHEYLPFSGLKDFQINTAKFAWGNTAAYDEGRISTIQTISGTGGLRVGSQFLSRFMHPAFPRTVYLPNPTYVNHLPIFELEGFSIRRYRYYDLENNCLDYDGLREDLQEAPKNAIVLLHACAHNPTGMDPSQEQWKGIAEVCKDRGLVCFFDNAYQGFASGDSERDAFAYRHFVDQGMECLMAQSYAKNMGLYGQRIGALHVVSNGSDCVGPVMSNLNHVVRPMYSNPSAHGARIVATVLGTPDIYAQWKVDVKNMANRISDMRRLLVENLEAAGSKRDWSHITSQIGMFAYSGLKESEVDALRGHHVYLNYDGRMSMSGVNSRNVGYLAKAMHRVTQ